jgi:hypothetical protein
VVNQAGNRCAVESEWQKEMGIDEADRGEKMDTGGKRRLWREKEMGRRLSRGNTRAIDQGGNRGVVETEWRRSIRIDEEDRGEQWMRAGKALSPKNRIKLRHVYRSGRGFVTEDSRLFANVFKRSSH